MPTIRRGGSNNRQETVIIKKHIQQLSYNVQGNVEYLGLALAGTPTSNPTWQIRKMIYSNSDVIKILFAEGSSKFDKVWNNYANYNYA